MKLNISKTIAAAAWVATIVACFMAVGCQGRKMSNMEPKGETVDVVIQTSPEVHEDTPGNHK